MKKKFIALFAVCSMVTTAAMGLVHTAYAADPGITCVVTDGASANQKVLTFYYENVDGIKEATFYLDKDVDVTIDSVACLVSGVDNYAGIENEGEYACYMLTDGGKTMSSADGSFITATVTVPGDADTTLTLTVDTFVAPGGVDCTIDPVEVTIPAQAVTPPTPVVSTSVEAKQAFTTADNYDANVVVGTIQLTVSEAPIDLTKITYNDKEPEKVEGTDNPTAFQGSALITVIINGETDVNALNNIKFN